MERGWRGWGRGLRASVTITIANYFHFQMGRGAQRGQDLRPRSHSWGLDSGVVVPQSSSQS